MVKKALTKFWVFFPGFLSWLTIIVSIILAFVAPAILTFLVLIYVTYWLTRVFIITGHLLAGFWAYRREIKVNWLERLKKDYPHELDKYYHLVIIPTYK